MTSSPLRSTDYRSRSHRPATPLCCEARGPNSCVTHDGPTMRTGRGLLTPASSAGRKSDANVASDPDSQKGGGPMTVTSSGWKARAVALGSAVLVSLATTSCGPQSATPSAPHDGLQVVSFPASAYNSAIGSLPIAVADRLGYFEEEGIRIEPVPVGGGGESVRGYVADRNAALGSVGFLAALAAIDQGEGFRIFGQLSQQQDTWIAVANN